MDGNIIKNSCLIEIAAMTTVFDYFQFRIYMIFDQIGYHWQKHVVAIAHQV
jgi:hypothetical protein